MDQATIDELVEMLPCEELVNEDGEVYAVVTPPGRLSFHDLKEPNEDGKRTAVVLFPPSADLSLIDEAIERAGAAKWGASKFAKMKTDVPLKDAENDPNKIEKEYEGYEDAGNWLAMSNIAEKVDVAFQDASNEKCDPSEFYSGAWVRARVSFKGNDYKRNSVTCYFTGLQFLCDDTEFKGSFDPGQGFGAVPAAIKAKAIKDKANGKDSAASRFM